MRTEDDLNVTMRASTSAVHFSSESVEHYTPSHIVARVVACLGAIDLDPCSNDGTPNVPASRQFAACDDGLVQVWSGRVFMNPPYGRGIIDRWVTKLVAEHRKGNVPEAIALVPARPGSQWFQGLRDFPVCFVEGRLTFIGNQAPAPFPSALVYLGDDIGRFVQHFAQVGDIYQRVNVREDVSSLDHRRAACR